MTCSFASDAEPHERTAASHQGTTFFTIDAVFRSKHRVIAASLGRSRSSVALPTLPHAARSAAPFGAALDHLTAGGWRSAISSSARTRQ